MIPCAAALRLYARCTSRDEKPAVSNVTQGIAAYVSRRHVGQFDAAVHHEVGRALLNFFACAIGASRHVAVEAALSAVQPFAGPP